MTITYNETSRRAARNGVDITVAFTDGGSGTKMTKTFYFDKPAPTTDAITARMAKAVTNIQAHLDEKPERFYTETEVLEVFDKVAGDRTKLEEALKNG